VARPQIVPPDESSPVTDPVQAARAAGLRYVSDTRPGIVRRRAGRGFTYIGTNGTTIRDPGQLRWIKSLAIPPAWTNVWICPQINGHILATGRDEKGRKQYKYHPRWREARDETKYHRMISFAESLPAIRQRVQEDLGLRGLQRRRILAAVVQLLDETAIRIGNEEYARTNQSFGLTTLHQDHVDVTGSTLHFHFVGKAGKEHVVDVRDRRVAKIVRQVEELPGQELFQYVDEEGKRHSIGSHDVNAYLQEISGEEFTAKDFRTWHGTVTAAEALRDAGPSETKTEAKRHVKEAIERAAQHLGNTPAICRKSYVHPGVIDAYNTGALFQISDQDAVRTDAEFDLEPAGKVVLMLLRQQFENEQAGRQRVAS
jgi:DNA topoisomerase-1